MHTSIFDNNNPLFSSKNNPSVPLIKFLSIGKLNNLPSPIFTFPSRFISRLGARHRDLEPLSTSTPSTFAPFYPRLSRKRRCSSRAPLLGMHRALEREREREGRGEGGGGWSSWFAASVINVRALEASLDHIAFVINRFGGSLGLRRHYVLYVSLQISFSVVRGPCTYVHDHSHGESTLPTGRDRKEREKNLSWDDGERTRQKWMLPYSPSDINSCYSYVSPAGSRKRMEEEASSPLLFVLSDSFLSVEASQGLPTFSKIIWKTFDITYFIRHMRNEDCQALKSRRLVYKNTFSASTRGLLNLLLLCVYIYDILMHKYVSVGIFQRMKRRGGPVTLCSLPVLNCETIHKRL